LFSGFTVPLHLNVLFDTEMKDQQFSPKNNYGYSIEMRGSKLDLSRSLNFFPRREKSCSRHEVGMFRSQFLPNR
jgi:hypothetical protein